MKIVLDTNVLVSALLTPHGPPGRILDGVLAGEVGLVVDDRIMDEYRLVLARPKFSFSEPDIADLLHFLESEADHVAAVPLKQPLPDADDSCFVEVAVAGAADCLVTGNIRHFPEELVDGVRVLTPTQFLAVWRLGPT